MTKEEKLQLINEACDKFNEANKLIVEAKKLFNLCDIEFCAGFQETPGAFSYNLQLFSGIKNLAEIIDKPMCYKKDFELGKEYTRSGHIVYNGIKFMQLSQFEIATPMFR